MEPLWKDWMTIGLSSAALLISCASLVLSWRNFARDASRLRILLRFEIRPGSTGDYTLRVMNVGRRPASISSIRACLKSGEGYPVLDTTTALTETQFKDVRIPMAGFGDKHPLYIRAFEVEDTNGKIYRTRTWKLWWQIRGVLHSARKH